MVKIVGAIYNQVHALGVTITRADKSLWCRFITVPAVGRNKCGQWSVVWVDGYRVVPITHVNCQELF